MSNRQGSPNSSTPLSISFKLLRFAEYTSLAASVVGTIASAVSQQVFYAAAPLTISLALNLANRNRFEAQSQRRLTTTINRVDEALHQVEQQIVHLQEQATVELNQHLAHLDEQLASTVLQADFHTAVSEFEARLAQLTQQLSSQIRTIQQELQSQPSRPSLTDLQAVEQSLTRLQEQMTALELQTQQLQIQRTVTGSSAFEEIRQSIQTLFDRLLALEVLDLQHFIDRVETLIPVDAEVTERQDIILPHEDDELEELYLNLGIDFGTSFTKVCFRDIARNRSEIVTFSDNSPHLEAALLPTQIGILLDGTLITGLTETEWKMYEPQIETTVELIKMRLADLDLQQGDEGWRLEQLPELDQPEMVENLCAYYLSRVIDRAQSWIRRNKPDLLINHRIEWSANVGVPVTYCDSPALARFEKVLSLAWLLSNEPQTERFTLENLTKQMKVLRSRLASNPLIDCFATPEVAAEAWSFFNSREADDGFYVFFDIGDGTLDGTAFYYYREDGEPHVNFYAAAVKPLGVTALSQQLASELNLFASEVKVALGDRSQKITGIQLTASCMRVQQLVASVVSEGKSEHFKQFPQGLRSGASKPDFQDPLKVFLGGGGSQAAFYQQTVTSTHANFKHQRAGIPPYSLKFLPVPKDLSINKSNQSEFYRFAVAYGLSLPVYEGAKVCLPSQVEAYRPQQGRIHYPGLRDRHVDTKDLC